MEGGLRFAPAATLGFVAHMLPLRAAAPATLHLAITASGIIDIYAFDHLSMTLFHKVLLAAFNSSHR